MIDRILEIIWGKKAVGIKNVTINEPFIEHGGGFPGVSAYVCMAPSERIGVVVVSNHDKTPTQKICYKVLDTLFQNN